LCGDEQVTALGIVSIIDQVLEGLPAAEREAVFDAFVAALEEDPAQYRSDAARMEAWAKGLAGAADIKPDAGKLVHMNNRREDCGGSNGSYSLCVHHLLPVAHSIPRAARQPPLPTPHTPTPVQLLDAADGDDGQRALARVAEAAQSSSFLYTKFFAVGLFRLLELAGEGGWRWRRGDACVCCFPLPPPFPHRRVCMPILAVRPRLHA
jgi:hypothetical protein